MSGLLVLLEVRVQLIIEARVGEEQMVQRAKGLPSADGGVDDKRTNLQSHAVLSMVAKEEVWRAVQRLNSLGTTKEHGRRDAALSENAPS